jgi:hypothetical protein
MELINGRTPEEIKHVTEWACFSCGGLECDECEYRDACTIENRDRAVPDALALIQHLEAQQPKWISVKERLPEDVILDGKKSTRYKAIKVLVAIKGSNGVTTIRTQTRFKDYSYKSGKEYLEWRWRESIGKVTHWMPLPNPPKEDAHE